MSVQGLGRETGSGVRGLSDYDLHCSTEFDTNMDIGAAKVPIREGAWDAKSEARGQTHGAYSS